MHLLLALDYLMINVNFSLCQRSELHVLLLQSVVLLFHVRVDLYLLLVNKLLVKIDDLLQILELLCLLFDPVSVILSQVEIHGGHIDDGLLVHLHLFLLLLKLGNHSH